MLVNHQCSIPGNVPGNFFLALLINKASETADVNIVSIRHGIFYNTEKCFNRCCHISLVNSSLFCNLINYICFGHGAIFKSLKISGGQI